MKTPNMVMLYNRDGHWLDSVAFKSKFMAWIFHIILNNSYTHAGVRDY